jgi:hypothetical protein
VSAILQRLREYKSGIDKTDLVDDDEHSVASLIGRLLDDSVVVTPADRLALEGLGRSIDVRKRVSRNYDAAWRKPVGGSDIGLGSGIALTAAFLVACLKLRNSTATPSPQSLKALNTALNVGDLFTLPPQLEALMSQIIGEVL